jgi:hypothetical protein
MDEKCYELVSGAGLEPILIPRSAFIKEHKKLLSVLKSRDPKQLQREYADQKAEMADQLKGGRGKASGFIMRMMAENKLKHKGQYQNPTAPLAPESKMNAPVAFDLTQLANPRQAPGGKNRKAYGASPFIMKHFGTAQSVPFVPRGQRNNVLDDVPGETPQQKEARLRQKAQELLDKAAELAGVQQKKAKVGEFLKGQIKIRRAKDELERRKDYKAQREIAERNRLAEIERRAAAERRRVAEAEERRVAEERRREEEAAERVATSRRAEEARKEEKRKSGGFVLPRWWDGVMCVEAWAKKDDEKYKYRWFGKQLWYAVHNEKGVFNEFFFPITKKEEKTRENRKRVVDAVLKLGSQYAKWLFTIALPAKGYNLVEFHPTEATFPETDVIETRAPAKMGGEYTYHKTGRKEPSGTRMVLGKVDSSYRRGDAPPPLPETITILVEPTGKLAWLISTEQGDARWNGLAEKMLRDNVSGYTGFSFSTKFKKVGDKWVNLIPEVVDGATYYQRETPQKVGDFVFKDVANSNTLLGSNPPKEGSSGRMMSDRHIDWAYPVGIAEITGPIFENLSERKEWSGKPLVEIDLSDKPAVEEGRVVVRGEDGKLRDATAAEIAEGRRRAAEAAAPKPKKVDVEAKLTEYLEGKTPRQKATIRQRVRYWTSGAERAPVPREEAILRVIGEWKG